MKLIPTHCAACGHFALAGEAAMSQGGAHCAQCGSRAQALPGESYAPRDQSLFDGFAQALRASRIDGARALQLLHELDERRGAGARNRVSRLGEIVPSLGTLELIVAENGFPARKAEGVLLMMLRALAVRTSDSGLRPAIGAATSATGSGD